MYADYIDSCFNLQKGGNWKAINAIVSKPMNATTDAMGNIIYKGELSFDESKDGVIAGDKKAEIVLSKSEKQFGGTQREVWTIYLCFIE